MTIPLYLLLFNRFLLLPVWNYLKRVEMGNLCCRDLSELRGELRKAIARLRHKSHIIQSFIPQAGLESVV